jgi:hypothetical protein
MGISLQALLGYQVTVRSCSMPFSDTYRRQVELLIRTLPAVAEEQCLDA